MKSLLNLIDLDPLIGTKWNHIHDRPENIYEIVAVTNYNSIEMKVTGVSGVHSYFRTHLNRVFKRIPE